MSKILVSGASGFIGKAVIKMLLEETDHEIVALSRYERVSDHARLTWKRCDLFSLKDLSEAMVGVDYPFTNGKHYPFENITFKIIPEGFYNINNNLVSDPIIDGCE